MTLKTDKFSLAVDFETGRVTSLFLNGKERVEGRCPLFRLRLRNEEGALREWSAWDAKTVLPTPEGAVYTGFPGEDQALRVEVSLTLQGEAAEWRLLVAPVAGSLAEWVDFPQVSLPPLRAQSPRGGAVLLPYNEGVLIEDWELRQSTSFAYREPEYPSKGSNFIFPNMMFAQMQAYLWEDAGLYIGAHDPARGVKGIDFEQTQEGVRMQLRHYCGAEYGETVEPGYPVVWAAVGTRWEEAAAYYRRWLETALPPCVQKIPENKALPAWYGDSPLVVTYPVRGEHDTDEMVPNRMYPYTNALPKLQAIRQAVDSRLLVLLMHWEGTAPWAPPYVWPPYGDAENFWQFRETLRQQGDLMGVYCSGFGYTLQSNVLPEYRREADLGAMCAGPDGKVELSAICTAQRSGYDLCPASEQGERILEEAYEPLLQSGLDYAQILDQNHGGAPYFCYSKEHGHPPAPGRWMTEGMQRLLSRWNARGGGMLLGCESAAAEPFIGNLLFSDNRFELNYRMGRPVPLYAYLYHEYLRNFMGNQVSCPLREQDDENLWYRLAYSFAAGDCLTLVLDQDGQIRSRWGKTKLEEPHLPDQAKVLRLVHTLTALYHNEAKPYLYAGRMITPLAVDCPTVEFRRHDGARTVVLPAVVSTAWQAPDGRCAQLLVNPTEKEVSCRVGTQNVTVPPMEARLLPL